MSQSCSKCNADNRDVAKFCRHCGVALHPEELGNVIEANTIILRDKSGMPRTVLSSSDPNKNVVVLSLIDEQGTERLTMGISEERVGLDLKDKQGCQRICVQVGETGQFGGLPTGLTIRDDDGSYEVSASGPKKEEKRPETSKQ